MAANAKRPPLATFRPSADDRPYHPQHSLPRRLRTLHRQPQPEPYTGADLRESAAGTLCETDAAAKASAARPARVRLRQSNATLWASAGQQPARPDTGCAHRAGRSRTQPVPGAYSRRPPLGGW